MGTNGKTDASYHASLMIQRTPPPASLLMKRDVCVRVAFVLCLWTYNTQPFLCPTTHRHRHDDKANHDNNTSFALFGAARLSSFPFSSLPQPYGGRRSTSTTNRMRHSDIPRTLPTHKHTGQQDDAITEESSKSRLARCRAFPSSRLSCRPAGHPHLLLSHRCHLTPPRRHHCACRPHAAPYQAHARHTTGGARFQILPPCVPTALDRTRHRADASL